MKQYFLSELVDSLGCSYGKELGELEVDLEVAKVSNINGQGRFHKKFETRSFSQKEVEKLSCKKGDLLVVKSSGSKKNILSGKTAICDFEHEGTLVATNFLMRLRPNKELVEPKYLWYVLNSEKTKNFIKTIVGTTTYPNLKWNMYGRLKVELPTLAEQQRVTAILDKADEIKSASKQATGLRDKFIDSVYNEFSENSESIRMTIQQLLDQEFITLHKDGNHGSEYPRKSEFGEEGIPFLSANCFDDSGNFIPIKVKLLNPQKAMRLKHGRILKNDVLLAHNATVGRVALYDGRFESAMIGTSLTCFRCNNMKLNPHFLYTAFRSRDFQMQLEKNMGQSTRNQVPITSQRKLSINIPKISVQNLIASLVENANYSFGSIANQVDLIILLNESSSQQIIS